MQQLGRQAEAGPGSAQRRTYPARRKVALGKLRHVERLQVAGAATFIAPQGSTGSRCPSDLPSHNRDSPALGAADRGRNATRTPWTKAKHTHQAVGVKLLATCTIKLLATLSCPQLLESLPFPFYGSYLLFVRPAAGPLLL